LRRPEPPALFEEKWFSIQQALDRGHSSRTKYLRRVSTVVLCKYAIDTIFVRMKTVEAYLILYNDKDHQTNRYPDSEASNVDERIVPVAN